MLLQKLQVLGIAASWDSCGGVKQKSFRKAGIPLEFSPFIQDCAATSEKCRLMKVLQSNKCIHDCKYCVNSISNGLKKELEPKEIAESFSLLARKGFVEGLFLSSAVTRNADSTAEKMIESARILRQEKRFQGYIHLKVLPGMSKDKIFEMAKYADRLSLNIEAPSAQRFSELGSTKDYFKDLEKRLEWINVARKKGFRISFTTQFILGAAGETDLEVLSKMNSLYEKTFLWRSYFSAFSPVKGTGLENKKGENPLREHRLYQSDWLLRVYGFKLKELKMALNEKGMLSLEKDPKLAIALNSLERFPVNPNNAKKEELLRVPGIGLKTVEKIELAKQNGERFQEFKDLKRYGVVLQKAMPFLQLEKERQARISDFCQPI
ncbi:MAG: radical SAM protein [Candidatus Diapherotrites archaeon]